MGSVWNRLGSNVTVIEALERIIPNADKEISNSFIKSLQKQGIKFKLKHKVIKTAKNNKDVSVEIESLIDNKKSSEKYSKILVSIGRKPYTEKLNLNVF